MTAAYAASAGARAHVLVGELADEVTVSGEEGHHLARVRRLRSGERVTAADGRGTWRPYDVVAVEGRSLVLRAVGEPVGEPVPATEIALAFAPTKGGRSEQVVQHATELGVDRLHLLVTERTVVRHDEQSGARARARLARVAREAAAQSFRSRLPEIGPTLTVDDLAGLAGVVVADRGGDRLPDLERGGTWTLAVGPEGGFDPAEASRLEDRPRLGLGDLVLRAETAALAGCTILTTLRDG